VEINLARDVKNKKVYRDVKDVKNNKVSTGIQEAKRRLEKMWTCC